MGEDQFSSLHAYNTALYNRKEREKHFLTVWYPQIIKTFGFSPEEDRQAAKLLSQILKDFDPPNLISLFQKIYQKSLLVAGAGPSLSDDLELALRRSMIRIASDGAARAFLDSNCIPDIVVTDGDGLQQEDLRFLAKNDVILIIHAHGDNIPFLKSLPEDVLKNQVIGSTQTPSLSNVTNFGGFTDGDRAVLLAETMAAHEIVLVGMDFGSIVGRYSKPPYLHEIKADKSKKLKLKFARDIISEVIATTKIPVHPISKIA